MWRYAAMLPVWPASARHVTLGEGRTPPAADQWAGRELYWKLDALDADRAATRFVGLRV
jgi:hypothetical protein